MFCTICGTLVLNEVSHLCDSCRDIYFKEREQGIYPKGLKVDIYPMGEYEWIEFRMLGKKAQEEQWPPEKVKEEVNKLVAVYNEGREQSQRHQAAQRAKQQAAAENLQSKWRLY